MSKAIHKPYIGTRDFFPDEFRFRQWMFHLQRQVCTRYGYQEYGSPLLEPLDLYSLKSSQEIVNEQVYSFSDRGKRNVAIRPEATPSLARMVSSKRRELALPVRWFSITNFMRYERPGHGRLREFFQLNVDLLGEASVLANVEIVRLATDLLHAYGATKNNFQLRYNDLRLFSSYLGLKEESLRSLTRVIDKRTKLKSSDEFDRLLQEGCALAQVPEKEVRKFLEISKDDLTQLSEQGKLDKQAVAELLEFDSLFCKEDYKDVLVFDPTLMRGFDYYTGFVFEAYDCHPENKRALLGGGRYDRLLELFHPNQALPAVGFGLGDVTLEHFLRNHDCLPAELTESRGVFVVLMSKELETACLQLAQELRSHGIEVEQVLNPGLKLRRQFELADKKKRRFVIILGEEELQDQEVTLKDLVTGKQQRLKAKELLPCLKQLMQTVPHTVKGLV